MEDMRVLTCTASLLLLSVVPAIAQTGRAGATWQTEIDIEKEKRAAFLVENERLSPEEWREAALATISFRLGERELVLRDLARVADAVADKKAVTEKSGGAPEPDEDAEQDDVEDYFGLELGGEEPEQSLEEVWTVRFGKKAPRTLKLTLTDTHSTEVSCSMKDLEAAGGGTIGIFQNEYVLLCVVRDLEGSG
jgi:hypothetical protein